MRHRYGLQCFALVLLFPVQEAWAQAPEALTLAAAIAEARASHPALRAAAERIRSTEGLRVQAGLGLNPRMILQAENVRGWDTNPRFQYPRDADTLAYLSQIFESAQKRQRRVEFASGSVLEAKAERAMLERQIAGRVSLAYWSAVAAARVRDVLVEGVGALDRIVQYQQNRVREGVLAEVDLLRVRLERDRVNVTARTADEEYNQASIMLAREMGRSSFGIFQLTDPIGEVRQVPEPDLSRIFPLRPEWETSRAALQRAEANLRLQRANGVPDPEVVFGYKRTSGLDTLLGGFQLNLPVRNRNQGLIASAEAEIRIVESQTRALENQIRAEVAAAWSIYQARQRLLTDTLDPMRERADEIARISLAAYQEGGFDLLRLIDAQRTRLDTLSAYYRALSDYQQSVTALQIATGAPL